MLILSTELLPDSVKTKVLIFLTQLTDEEYETNFSRNGRFISVFIASIAWQMSSSFDNIDNIDNIDFLIAFVAGIEVCWILSHGLSFCFPSSTKQSARHRIFFFFLCCPRIHATCRENWHELFHRYCAVKEWVVSWGGFVALGSYLIPF